MQDAAGSVALDSEPQADTEQGGQGVGETAYQGPAGLGRPSQQEHQSGLPMSDPLRDAEKPLSAAVGGAFRKRQQTGWPSAARSLHATSEPAHVKWRLSTFGKTKCFSTFRVICMLA